MPRFEDAIDLLQQGYHDEAMVKCHEVANAHSEQPEILAFVRALQNSAAH